MDKIPILEQADLLSAETVEAFGNLTTQDFLFTLIALGISFMVLLIGMYFRSQSHLQAAHVRTFTSMEAYMAKSREREDNERNENQVREHQARADIAALRTQVETLIASEQEARDGFIEIKRDYESERKTHNGLKKKHSVLQKQHEGVLAENTALKAELEGIYERLNALEKIRIDAEAELKIQAQNLVEKKKENTNDDDK